MVAQSDKRLIWHPRGQNKFIVGGSTQITLYEWLPHTSEIKQVASQLELTQMKVRIAFVRSTYFPTSARTPERLERADHHEEVTVQA